MKLRGPSIAFISFIWLFAVLFTFWRAYENPRLLAATSLDVPLILVPDVHGADRRVAGYIQTTGEAVKVRATAAELAQVKAGGYLTVFRTKDKDCPLLTAGQIARIQPIYDFGAVQLSWRVFLATGLIALWFFFVWLYRRHTPSREFIGQCAVWLAPAFLALALVFAGGLLL